MGDKIFRNLSREQKEIIVLLAIEYFSILHTKNFFLGDVKPENLFFSQNYKLTSTTRSLVSLGKNNELEKP